ncbi:MAG: VCBS repeat-containing protein [Alphaproteobacteria bacterium]|nr:VCBS repeat-containing protein [Alphaproteobacteria bacterium]
MRFLLHCRAGAALPLLLACACNNKAAPVDSASPRCEASPVDGPLPEALPTLAVQELDISELEAGDLDGDGCAELLVTTRNTLEVIRGPVTPDLSRAPLHVDGTFGQTSGAWEDSPLATFDVDGDGQEELLLGGWSADPDGYGAVRLLRLEGWAFTLLGEYTGPEVSGHYLGRAVSPAGDQDDDGQVDLLVAGNFAASAAYLISAGTPSGPVEEAARLVVRGGEHVGWDVDAADLDGDGRPELVISATDAVAIFAAGTEGVVDMADADALHRAHTGIAAVLTPDPDGDGVAELWVGAWEAARVLRFAEPMAPEAGPTGAWINRRYLGDVLVAPGDLDGDGRGEVALRYAPEAGGKAWVVVTPQEGTVDLGAEAPLLELRSTWGLVPVVLEDDTPVLATWEPGELRLLTLR